MKFKKEDLIGLGLLVGSVVCVKFFADQFTIPRQTQITSQVQPTPKTQISKAEHNELSGGSSFSGSNGGSSFSNIDDINNIDQLSEDPEDATCLFAECGD